MLRAYPAPARLRALVQRDRVKLIVDLNLLTDTPFTAAAVGARGRDLTPARQHRRLRDRERAGSVHAPLLGGPDRPLPARHPRDAAGAHPGHLRPGFRRLRARARREAHPTYRWSGRPWPSPGRPAVHLRPDRRPAARARHGDRPPVSVLRLRQESEVHGYPTVARLLSRHATSAFATYLASAVALAHRAGLPFRLTEFNSVTCGGKARVSNTFATALWAPDALFTAMRAGVSGANLHVREDTINAAFTINGRGVQPRPLLYGLMHVHPHARAASATGQAAPRRGPVTEPQRLGRTRSEADILHVLLIDKGSRTAQVDLRLPATAPAAVQRLLAASPYSRTGVTLNGQELNSAGDWTGTPTIERITPGPRGGYELTLPRHSAALVSVPLAPTRPRRAARLRTRPWCWRDEAPGPRSGPGRPAPALDARRRRPAAPSSREPSRWLTRITSCSMIGPASSSSVT